MSGTITKTNNGLVVWQSVMAGLTFISSASVLGDVVPERWAAVFLIMVGALQSGTAAYVAGAKPVETNPAPAPAVPFKPNYPPDHPFNPISRNATDHSGQSNVQRGQSTQDTHGIPYTARHPWQSNDER